MLGQEFIITDADGFTREYYRNELGVSLPAPLPRPKVLRKDIGAQYATGIIRDITQHIHGMIDYAYVIS